MPYKNKERQKAHDKQYYQENKEQRKAYAKQYYQENKERVIAHKRQYRRGNRKRMNAHDKQYRREMRREALELFGNCCFFCSKDGNKCRVEFHNKAGNSHTAYSIFLILNNPKEWVLLCYICHRGVHFCMDHLGITWDELIKRRQSKNYFNQKIKEELNDFTAS